MSVSTALSKYRAAVRRVHRSRGKHHKAQVALEQAREKDLHPRQQLVNAAQETLALLTRRKDEARDAKRELAAARKAKRRPPHAEYHRNVVNQSSRYGVKPRLIVLHITVSHNRPGAADALAIADFFNNSSAQASSHLVIDAEGHSVRCVPDGAKAWTQAAFNPQALSIEQVEYADKPRAQWLAENKAGLERTALQVAWWAHKYGIPITHSTYKGVCQHRDLGAAGGGHTDCGPGYPFDWVLARAREIKF